MRSTATIAALVTGSNSSVRREIAGGLGGDSRIDVVGDVDAVDLAQAARDLVPDVIVFASGMTQTPDIPSVVLVEDVREAWLAVSSNEGARAILPRDASLEEIGAAVIAVAAGLVAVPPSALSTAGAAVQTPEPAERLTPRESEVLGELARGSATKVIAGRLDISEHTVKFHIASIFAKLGVSNRTGAVTQGVRLGLIML